MIRVIFKKLIFYTRYYYNENTYILQFTQSAVYYEGQVAMFHFSNNALSRSTSTFKFLRDNLTLG
jgi:hypothetical protein